MHNIIFAKAGVSCFYESLVQVSSSVFQMNISAKNPRLRKYENRHRQLYLTMKRFLIFQFMLLPLISIGQNSNDTTLTYIYNTILKTYFYDTISRYNGIVYYDKIEMLKNQNKLLIRVDIDTNNLIKNIDKYNLVYINNSSSLTTSVLDKPLKKNINKKVCTLKYIFINTDTIDVSVRITEIKKIQNKIIAPYFWTFCGGTRGYIPDYRFYYDKDSNTWKFYTSADILIHKDEEEKQFLMKK